MASELKQVLRLLMLMAKQRQQRVAKTAAAGGGGGLLVLLWSEQKNTPQGLNCTVAAAGSWCRGIKMRQFQSAFTDLKERVFPCAFLCPDPDPEELSAFTELYGSPGVLLSFQIRDAKRFSPECQTHIETLLKMFSLVNAGIEIYLTYKFNQQTIHSEFRAPKCVKKECWCQGGHPVLGDPLSLSIQPQVMDGGLYGELSVQPVTLLSPCVLQYPNVATQLTHIQVLVYGPSNVPLTGPSTFLKSLPGHLDYKELGLHSLHCSKDLLRDGTVYEVQQENGDTESSLPTMHQSLLLLLFLQYSDPFTSEMSDVMAAETLIEHHLEEILCNNSQTVTAALQAELKNALKPQNQRKRKQEKLSTAVDVIVSSSVSIVSRSSDLDFRNACLNRMKVPDTHQLSATLRETLRRVTSWKFTPRSQCYSAPMDENLEGDESTRTEM